MSELGDNIIEDDRPHFEPGPTDAHAELREEIARWFAGKHSVSRWDREMADAVLALPAVRDALAAQEAVKRVEALHKPVMNWTSPECETCSTFDDDCSHIAPWPCPTARALDEDAR